MKKKDGIVVFAVKEGGGIYYDPRFLTILLQRFILFAEEHDWEPAANEETRSATLQCCKESLSNLFEIEASKPWEVFQITEFYLLFTRAFLLAVRYGDTADTKSLLPSLAIQANFGAELPGQGLRGLEAEFTAIFDSEEQDWLYTLICSKYHDAPPKAFKLFAITLVCFHLSISVYAYMRTGRTFECQFIRHEALKFFEGVIDAVDPPKASVGPLTDPDQIVEEQLVNIAIMSKTFRCDILTPESQWIRESLN